MAQLKVTVNKLNKRSSVPASFADTQSVVGTVALGYTFTGNVAQHIPNPALGTWYQSDDGFYYWGGGVQVVVQGQASIAVGGLSSPYLNLPFDPAKMSWGHNYLGIPDIWTDLGTAGREVVVAVIDTGVDNTNDDLIPNILPGSKDFTGTDTSDTDQSSHGTNMAGIIAASGKRVYGVAPEAKLLIVKGTQAKIGANAKQFADAINYAAGLKEVDIISISYAFTPNYQDIADINAAFQNCITAGKTVVGSIGNLHIANPDANTYPACYDGCVAIGAFDGNGQLCTYSNWNQQLAFLAPGDNAIKTTARGNTVCNTGSGTSIATAFTAGCLALMLSYARISANGKTMADCVQFIAERADPMNGAKVRNVSTGFGRLNLRNAITKLK